MVYTTRENFEIDSETRDCLLLSLLSLLWCAHLQNPPGSTTFYGAGDVRAAKGTTRDNTGWTRRFLNRPRQPISQRVTHKDGERMRSYQDSRTGSAITKSWAFKHKWAADCQISHQSCSIELPWLWPFHYCYYYYHHDHYSCNYN